MQPPPAEQALARVVLQGAQGAAPMTQEGNATLLQVKPEQQPPLQLFGLQPLHAP